MRLGTYIQGKFARTLLIFAAMGIFHGCGGGIDSQLKDAAMRLADARVKFTDQHFVESLALLSPLISFYESVEADSLLGEALLLAARNQRHLGQYSESLNDFGKALNYAKRLSNHRLERECRMQLSAFLLDLKDYAEAAAMASDASAGALVFGDTVDFRRALLATARAGFAGGAYEQSIRSLKRLFVLSARSPEEEREAFTLLVRNYAAQRNDSLVWRTFNRWRTSMADSRDSLGMLGVQIEYGRYFIDHDRPDSAMRAYARGLQFVSPGTDPGIRSRILTLLGATAYRLHQFENARTHFIDALELAHGSGNLLLEQLLKSLVIACDLKNNAPRGSQATEDLLARIDRVQSICKDIGYGTGEAFAAFLDGVIWEHRGNADSAVASFLHALELRKWTSASADDAIDVQSEAIGAYMTSEETGWFDAPLRIAAGRSDARLLLALSEAKNLSELSAFFRKLTIEEPDGKVEADVRDMQWKLRALSLLGDDIERELGYGTYRSDPGRFGALHTLFDQRLADLSTAADRMEGQNKNLRWLLLPKTVSAGELRSLISPQNALIEFIPTPSMLYTVVVRSDTVLLYRLAIRQAALQASIDEFLSVIADQRVSAKGGIINEAASFQRLSRLSSHLYEVLLAPSASSLKGVTKSYFVLPQEFRWMPVHILQGSGIGGQFENEEGLRSRTPPLVSRMNISYLPSASVLFYSIPRERVVRNIVGLGHPGSTGWDVEYELKDIRSFYDKAQMLFDTTATLDHLRRAEYDVLHIAAEFHVDPRAPDRSVVVLSNSLHPLGTENIPLGRLTVAPTARSMVFSNISGTPGELFRYVPALFLAQGTSTFIGTMWQGDRKAKKYFGEVWYTNLLAGTSASDAYAAAMNALSKKGEFSRPTRWGLYYQFGK